MALNMLRLMIPRSLRQSVAVALALSASLFVAACEKTPFLAPTGSSISLTSATTALAVNGSATITAQVLESSGTPPHSGTRVTFTTTLGTIEPSEVSTDASGRATVTFRAGGSSGVAIIAASSGAATTSGSGGTTTTTGGTSTSTGDRNLRIAVGAAAVGRIVLGASPTTIPATGGTATVSAAVTDVNGNPLASVPVIFTTTAGTLGASSIITDAAGLASTTLTTSVEATVTASAGLSSGTGGTTGGTSGGTTTTTGSASASVTIKVNPVPTLTITPASTGTLTAGQPVIFTVTATIPSGSTSQIRSMSIDFGDGDRSSLGAANGTTTVQHVYNNASTQSYTVTVTLVDTLGATTSASTVIVVLPQPPLAATIAFTKAVSGSNTVVTFTATVTPATATVVSYFWDFGDSSSQTTTANQAIHPYASSPANLYNVRVRITTSTGTQTEGVAAVPIP